MTVKELCDALRPGVNGEKPVFVRATWHGEAPAHGEFRILGVDDDLEPDTGEEEVWIDCTQDGGLVETLAIREH